MPIPSFQKFMLPVLQILAESGQIPTKECARRVADREGLSEQEGSELLPSGKQTYLLNRIGWACWTLLQSGLVTRPKRGTYQITEEGKKLLAENPKEIDYQLLSRYPSFVERVLKNKAQVPGGGGGSGKGPEVPPLEEAKTPHERIEAAFSELRGTLITELLDSLAVIDPFRFEQVVLDVLVAMGYGGSRKEAAEVTQKTNDEGIDGVINEDRLGLDVIYIQAKRWKGNVGRQELQNFVGALAGKKANKGIFITTSDFNSNARDYAANLQQKVILVDGRRLAELMIDHNVGVAEEQVYRIKKIDSDYFDDGDV
jgi:restriction system protein